MLMNELAPLRGTIVNYSYLEDGTVMILKENYKYKTMKKETFLYLYHELDGHRAALKTDCIEYTEYYHGKLLFDYPEWFIDAMSEGWVTTEYSNCFLFLEEGGEVAMSDGSIILRNYVGDLKYMEREEFEKYYEIIRSW